MIAYSPGSQRTAAVAETLAAAFDVSCAPRAGVDERRAALTVAEPSERRHHHPATPVVVLPAGVRAKAGVSGRIVLSASVRPLLVRALLGSATRHFARRSDRPLVVCPRDPRPAMRLREALGSSPTHAWWSR